MEWVWLIVILMMFTPYIVDCPQNHQAYADKPVAAIDFPSEYHIKNYGEYCKVHKKYHGEGSCVHASWRMALQWQGQKKIADEWLKTYGGGGEDFGTIQKKADPYCNYAAGKGYDFLKKCVATRRAPIIGIQVKADVLFFDFTVGYHSVLVVHADDHRVAIVDPNTDATPYWMSKEKFFDVWMGWAVVPVYTPPPPTPWYHESKHEVKIIFFHATWCQPCKRQEPIMEELSKKYPGQIETIDVDQSDLDEKFKVTSVPTMVIITRGNETSRYTGVIPKSVLEEHLK